MSSSRSESSCINVNTCTSKIETRARYFKTGYIRAVKIIGHAGVCISQTIDNKALKQDWKRTKNLRANPGKCRWCHIVSSLWCFSWKVVPTNWCTIIISHTDHCTSGSCAFTDIFYLTWAPPIMRVEWPWAYPRLRTGKGGKVAANLLHVSSYRGLNIIHTKHWTLSWLNNVQKVSFLFQSYFDYVMLMWKICQALYTCAICIPREPGNEAS